MLMALSDFQQFDQLSQPCLIRWCISTHHPTILAHTLIELLISCPAKDTKAGGVRVDDMAMGHSKV